MPDDWTMLILICNVIYWFRKCIWWYMYLYVCTYFQNTLVLVQNSLVLNSGYLTNFCCCYFRAEIMKQMKNLRKQMKKKSFQVNSEWMCSHVYLIIIWTNEQAHYSYNTRDFFLFYTQKYVDLFYWTCLYMKTQVCVNGRFMQRGYWNGMSNSIPGYFINEKLWTKVSPLCTMIDANIPKRMTIKAPQTNQNHNMISILIC